MHAIAVQGLLVIRLESGRPVRLDPKDPRPEHVLGALAHALGYPFEDRPVVGREVRELASAKCGHGAPFVATSRQRSYRGGADVIAPRLLTMNGIR